MADELKWPDLTNPTVRARFYRACAERCEPDVTVRARCYRAWAERCDADVAAMFRAWADEADDLDRREQ